MSEVPGSTDEIFAREAAMWADRVEAHMVLAEEHRRAAEFALRQSQRFLARITVDREVETEGPHLQLIIGGQDEST